MSEQDPPRLLSDDRFPELAATLEAGVRRLPDDAAMHRIAERLGATGAPSPPAAPAPAAAATSGGAMITGTKVALGGGVFVAAIAMAIVWLGRPTPTPTPTPSGAARKVAPEHVETAAAATSSGAPVGTQASGVDARAAGAPVAPRIVTVDAGVAARDQRLSRRATAAVAAVPTELELVAGAERALRREPARALSLANQHARLYPSGALSEERDVVVIEALGALGQRPAAAARANAFLRAHPRSGYRERVTHALGAVPGEAKPAQ